ncbi:MFS transporter [Luteibacter sp. Lutesp34]|uniref:MFS transporter n=1 Tax=Luteibacter sp. Lutesp34 TaxID=3243030 RepID=UPI0039B6952C
MKPALIALAAGAFAIGTTEFVIIGLVPGIARDLGITLPVAGLLVSGYALAVTVGAPTVTALVGHLPRRPLAVGLMLLFTLGNLLSGFASGYGGMLAGRIITGVAHGVFFSIGATIAMSLVERSRGARAVALMFAGLTVAMVVGVPSGTFIGQRLGWRAPFFFIAGLGALAATFLHILLPRQISFEPPAGLLSQFRLLQQPRLLMLYAIAALGYGGSFAVFTFLSPLMTTVTHVSETSVGLALAVFGAAAVVGNLVGGKLGDALGTRRGLAFALVGLLLALAALPKTAPHAGVMFVNIFFWSVCCFCTGPIVQAGVIAVAEKEAPGAVATASGFNIAAFNLGIAGASAVGGAILAGPGVMVTPFAAVAAVAAALAITPFVGAGRHG